MKGAKRIYVADEFAKKIKKQAVDADMSVTSYTKKMTKHLDKIKEKCKYGKK